MKHVTFLLIVALALLAAACDTTTEDTTSTTTNVTTTIQETSTTTTAPIPELPVPEIPYFLPLAEYADGDVLILEHYTMGRNVILNNDGSVNIEAVCFQKDKCVVTIHSNEIQDWAPLEAGSEILGGHGRLVGTEPNAENLQTRFITTSPGHFADLVPTDLAYPEIIVDGVQNGVAGVWTHVTDENIIVIPGSEKEPATIWSFTNEGHEKLITLPEDFMPTSLFAATTDTQFWVANGIKRSDGTPLSVMGTIDSIMRMEERLKQTTHVSLTAGQGRIIGVARDAIDGEIHYYGIEYTAEAGGAAYEFEGFDKASDGGNLLDEAGGSRIFYTNNMWIQTLMLQNPEPHIEIWVSPDAQTWEHHSDLTLTELGTPAYDVEVYNGRIIVLTSWPVGTVDAVQLYVTDVAAVVTR